MESQDLMWDYGAMADDHISHLVSCRSEHKSRSFSAKSRWLNVVTFLIYVSNCFHCCTHVSVAAVCCLARLNCVQDLQEEVSSRDQLLMAHLAELPPVA